MSKLQEDSNSDDLEFNNAIDGETLSIEEPIGDNEVLTIFGPKDKDSLINRLN